MYIGFNPLPTKWIYNYIVYRGEESIGHTLLRDEKQFPYSDISFLPNYLRQESIEASYIHSLNLAEIPHFLGY